MPAGTVSGLKEMAEVFWPTRITGACSNRSCDVGDDSEGWSLQVDLLSLLPLVGRHTYMRVYTHKRGQANIRLSTSR